MAVYICHSYLVTKQVKTVLFVSQWLAGVQREKQRDISFRDMHACAHVCVCVCMFSKSANMAHNTVRASMNSRSATEQILSPRQQNVSNNCRPITLLKTVHTTSRLLSSVTFVQRIARIIISESERENRRSILRFLQRKSAKQKRKKVSCRRKNSHCEAEF